MKRIFWGLLFALFCFTAVLNAQSFGGRSTSTVYVLPPYKLFFGEDDGTSPSLTKSGTLSLRIGGYLDFTLAPSTVAALPTASANTGRVLRVTDGNSSSDCTSGGGSTFVVCVSNGSAWVTLGSGGGGGGSSAGSNHAVQTSDGASGFSDGGCTMASGVLTCAPSGGEGGSFNWPEGVIPTYTNFGSSAYGSCYADSTSHTLKCKFNGGSAVNLLSSAGLAAIASGKTFTVSNTLTLSGTDGSSVAFGAGGTAMYTNTSVVKAQTPLTTKGDLWATDGSAMNRLGVGSDGQVLTADAASTNGVKWAAAASGGSAETYFSAHGAMGGYQTGQQTAVTNHLFLAGVYIPSGGLSVGHIVVGVPTGDASNNTSFCVYNSSGVLEAQTTAAHISAGSQSIAFTGGTQTITAGKHYIGFTSAASTIQVSATASNFNFYSFQDTSITSAGGACPAGPITPPADSFNVGANSFPALFIP